MKTARFKAGKWLPLVREGELSDGSVRDRMFVLRIKRDKVRNLPPFLPSLKWPGKLMVSVQGAIDGA